MQANPVIATAFLDTISRTDAEGFAGCAYALQHLDYLPNVGDISSPTTLIVGANDGPLPHVMQALQALIPGAMLEVISNAGHLPNIDQPVAFNTALMRHFSNHPSRS
jgi:3-oxoadipate enol-lactonase